MCVCAPVCVLALVPDPVSLQVDVYIFEPKGISLVETPNTLGAQFAELIRVTSSKDKVSLENTQRGDTIL